MKAFHIGWLIFRGRRGWYRWCRECGRKVPVSERDFGKGAPLCKRCDPYA